MKKYGYYPGCSLSATGLEMGISTVAVAKKLGLDLVEVPDWNCCGASSAHATDHNLALALPARNAAIAEADGLGLAIPCPACYARSKNVELAVQESEQTKEKIEHLIGRPYEAKYPGRVLLEIVANDVGYDSLASKVKRPLRGMKVASYYGCLLVRPERLTGFDDTENPQMMDKIVEALGGEPVEWNGKVKCCGGSLPTAEPKVGMSMTKVILDEAEKAGAECILGACPLCVTNVDMRQSKLGAKRGKDYNLPTLYFTELIGLALGLSGSEVGMNHHFVDAKPLVNRTILSAHQPEDPKEKAAAKAAAKAEAEPAAKPEEAAAEAKEEKHEGGGEG